MPHAIKLQDEFKKQGLVVMLVECQNSPNIPEFMLKKFPGNHCPLVERSQLPIKTTTRGLPSCALIGVDGTLVLEGYNSKLGGKVDDAIAAEIRKAKKGWGADKTIRKARGLLYGKNDIGGALALLEKAKVDQTAQEDFEAAKKEVEARYRLKIKCIRFLMTEGRWIDAKDEAKALTKAVKKHKDWTAEVKELNNEFKTKEAKAELSLDKKLSKFVRALEDAGVKGGESRRLRKLIKGKEGSVAARAEKLAGLLDNVH